MNQKTEKFKKLINRQRLDPKPWDYCYLLVRNNLAVFKQFRTLVEKNGKMKLLDVGCGFKPWLALFDPAQTEYLGIDFDKNMSSADFEGPANKLPFPDNTFDALIYSEVLEHVDDLSGALAEMKRVVKPGGLVYISTPFMFGEHGIPHDYQRLTRYFYQKYFGSQVIILQESNASFSTVLASLNLFLESSPFRIFGFLNQIIYFFMNILGAATDSMTEFLFSRIGKSYRKYFYFMPLGFALIVRVEK